MSIGAGPAGQAVTLGLQARDLEDAQRILTALLEHHKRNLLERPLDEDQRDRMAQDLANILTLWKSPSGLQTIKLDISFARGRGIR
ncbi:MAG: hypothetical protein HYT31_01680 [Parcubacteria group bacterium]|nr:hypothetical protein [Parcubacteria group bacterium]